MHGYVNINLIRIWCKEEKYKNRETIEDKESVLDEVCEIILVHNDELDEPQILDQQSAAKFSTQ